MTSKQLALRLRSFLIRAEKGTALLLNYEFDQLQKEILEYLRSITPADAAAKIEVDELVIRIEKMLKRRTVSFSKATGNAQKRVITAGAKTITAYLNTLSPGPDGTTSIFSPDNEALKKLLGRGQNGRPLSVYFEKLEPLFAGAARNQLAEGFIAGESADEIARRINDVTNIGKTRALTIARTETNEAFRAATREMYTESGRTKYVWMAVLDTRTCLTCWSLHGKIFNSSVKVFSHPRCRCVLLPFTGEAIATGEERFEKLEPGFQKQILGPGRYDLLSSGSVKFSDLTSWRKTDEGRDYFIRNLADLQ